MTDWTSLRYAVADVEGNGQQPPDLVELVVLPITDGFIGEPASWLVKPPRPITYFATSIHGISEKDVAKAPAFADMEHEARRALAGRVLVAHNAHVDVAVLRRELDGWEAPEVFDTLKLAKRLLPGQPSYKLGALVKALSLDDGMPPGLQPHRAVYDVLVTARLFARLATRHDGSPLSLDELRGRAGDEKPGGTDETASLF
jgi:DNA polymerase III epsilon subunit-like protein